MKHLLHRSFVALALLLLAVTACVEPLLPESPYKATVPVRFRVVTSDSALHTKSTDGLIAGADAAVTALYLYCFDINGRYLGRFQATEVTSTHTVTVEEPDDEGTFTGEIPPATARVHFVANADIAVGNDKIGMTEEEIFHGQDADTWGLTACKRDQIAYWGYHKEATAKAMADLFDPDNTATTTIYLLRDRARIEAGTFSTTLNPNYDATSVQWTIYNGKSSGYVAAYNGSGFDGYYSTASGTLKNTATLTPQANPARDVTDDGDLQSFTAGSWLYAFEDENEINGNDVSGAIRIIVKVAVKNSTQVLYFPVRLTDKEGNDQLEIHRGHRYQLNLGYLPVGLGYGTFAEAAAATSFANGQLVAIPVVVPEVSDGRFDLRITYELGEDKLTSTSALFEEWPDGNKTVRIPFEFKRNDGEAVTADDYSFSATWVSDEADGKKVAEEQEEDSADGIRIITTGLASGGKGYVEIDLEAVQSGILKSGTIRLLETKNKLERNIYVYSIKEFRLPEARLVANGTTGYRLIFQLPNGEGYSEYPEGLYPIKVKIASKSLQPSAAYNGQVAQENVVFGVDVRSTGTDVPGITSLGTSGKWDYQDPQWDFWYVYTITEKQDSPTYWIDLTDIRSSYATANQPSNVGLYMKIEFFGDTKALSYDN